MCVFRPRGREGDMQLWKWKLTHPVTNFQIQIEPMYSYVIKNVTWFWEHFSTIYINFAHILGKLFRNVTKTGNWKKVWPLIYQKVGLKSSNYLQEWCKIDHFFVAHPKYLNDWVSAPSFQCVWEFSILSRRDPMTLHFKYSL